MMEERADRFTLESINPLWRLHVYLTLNDAASLVAGYSPQQIARHQKDLDFDDCFPLFHPVMSALIGAVMAEDLAANICLESKGGQISGTHTRVRLRDLRKWLEAQGFREGFLFPDAKPEKEDFLNSAHPRYSAKLAAAVRAWQAVEDPKGKHPKQALERWLREHAAEFGLTDENGNPVNQAVEECAKVANWKTGGGAAKTPGN